MQHTPLYIFSSFMMQHVVASDARLASLLQNRDLLRYRNYYNILEDYSVKHSKLDNKLKEKFECELMLLTIDIYQLYSIRLIDVFEEKFNLLRKKRFVQIWDTLNQVDYSSKCMCTAYIFRHYKKLIDNLEKDLGIEQVKISSPETEITKKISSSIYNIDFEKLVDIQLEVNEALVYLDKEYKNHPELHSKERIEPLDFLVRVVYFELWNFISHISHAAAIFGKTPLSFISDLEKGRNHLRRALLDIYDGLIIDIYAKKITPEYLNLRQQKVESLGNSYDMQTLSIKLRDYYLKIR